MQQKLRLGLIGLNQTPRAWNQNMRRILDARDRAKSQNVDILVYPELTITGYGCEDLFLHPDTAARALDMCLQLAASCADEVLLVGLPIYIEGSLYNGVAVLNRGHIHGISLKSNLAREGIHYEPRWFLPWPLGEKTFLQLGEQRVPVGNLTYEVNGLKFILEICEDAWVDPRNRPCTLVKDIQWVFNSSASHFSMRKADIREKILVETSRNYNLGYAYANLVGCESGRAIYDGELLVAEQGQVVSRSNRLYLEEINLLCYDINYDRGPGGADVRLMLPEPASRVALAAPVLQRRAMLASEEFALAASLALFDYMRKSRANGFTLSLSGGVDSSVVAVLVWIMAMRVLSELSLEEASRRLAHIPNLDLALLNTPEKLVNRLLTTVYQATRNSGTVTRQAASELASSIGARHLQLEIDDLVSSYTARVGEAIGRTLCWETDDIALQNIQARVRAPGVWMLANLTGTLLLSTSNRSEVAVGYATMDGDTAGGLAPIAGVEKTFLRRWLKLMEAGEVEGFPALASLGFVNQQQPTAELRPPEQTQTDEHDLMPYEVLDALEESLISLRLPPIRAYQRVCDLMADRYTTYQLRHWTRKFCRMFATSQWKRERYAPAFHLDDSNLDPKTWARYPILSGAFAEELDELDLLP